MNKGCVAGCAVVAAWCAAAQAQVTLISQSRTFSPAGTPPPAGFGPWTGSATYVNGAGGGASASQTSDLSVTGATFNLGAGGNNGGASTTLDFVFHADAGVTFSLSGETVFNQGPPWPVSGYGTLTFTGPGVNISTPNFGIFTTIPWSYSGVLAGGDYTLHVEAHGSGGQQQSQLHYGNGSITGALTLTPTPGAAAAMLMGAAAALRRRR